tara:strand:+ start:999 stop:1472 length:474 start_codon:yes stop_codon:yes gene_type:complete
LTDNNNNNNTEATMEAEKQPTQVIASLTNPGTKVLSLMIHPCGSVTIHLLVRDDWRGGRYQTEVLEELHEEIKACGFEFTRLTTWAETPQGTDEGYTVEEWDALSDEERQAMDITRWSSHYEKWTEFDPTGKRDVCTQIYVHYNNLDRPNKAEEGGE